mgnify:CR=1 FL=1
MPAVIHDKLPTMMSRAPAMRHLSAGARWRGAWVRDPLLGIALTLLVLHGAVAAGAGALGYERLFGPASCTGLDRSACPPWPLD